MSSRSPGQLYWVIQPLVEAGLALEQIRVLLFRLGFEAIVTEGRGTAACVTALVSDQPPEVQAAWTTVIGRLITPHPPDPAGS